jgi:hypothetical protein
VNNNSEPLEAWPDDRLQAELARCDAVMIRISNEGARSHADLAAQARFIIADMGDIFADGDVAEMAVLSLLKDVAALCR